jgi:ubiquitin C-terminal hydrolase
LFSGVNANDSKDLLNFLLERLHTELNKASHENITQINHIQNLSQLNEEQSRRLFFEAFSKNHKSIISDLFYFTIETKSQCLGCNQCKYNFQISTFLEFPLEQVNNFCYENGKLNSLVNKDGSNPDVNLLDCFDYYQKIERMIGENEMYCNSCKRTCEALYSNLLFILPSILIINLNRGKNAIYKCNVNFPEELDLTQYVSYKDVNTQFQLYAVICHFGPSSNSGHFVAFCLNRMDHKWYLYNDSIVSLCKESQAYNKGMPYILFYQSKSNNIKNQSQKRRNSIDHIMNMLNQNNNNIMNQNNNN